MTAILELLGSDTKAEESTFGRVEMGSLVFGDDVIVSERRESVRGRSRGVFMSISSHLRLYKRWT